MSIDARVLLVSSLFFLPVSALACTSEKRPGGVADHGEVVVTDAEPPASPSPRVLAMTRDGAVAVIAGDSGAQLATSPPNDRAVHALAFDPTVGLVLQAAFDDLESGQL